MEYLLKASAVLVIFYLTYKLFLQKDTFFEQNRSFLLLGLITSILIPFVVIPIYIDHVPLEVLPYYNYSDIPAGIPKEEAPFNILDYLPILYLLGVLYFSVRFLIQVLSLSLLIYRNKKENHSYYTHVKTNKNLSPFSFFNWIVYNPKNYTEIELKQIITHEKVHANQKHSIDILLTQLSCIALWFNPFIWLYTKDVKQNLEFIADKEAQRKFNCNKSYQTTLLKTSMPTHQMAITNNFYTSLIKKRIIMLHKSKSKKINLFKYTLVIPILAVFIFNFNTKVIAQNKEKDEHINITGKSDAGVVIKLKDSDNPLIIIDGKEESDKSKLESLNHFNVESINVLKGEAAIKAYGDKGENGVMLITTNARDKSQWKVSAKRNKNVIYATKDTIYVNEKPSVLRELVNDYEKQPLYILDGKEITKKELNLIDEQTINSLSSIKGEQGKKEYGKKGENGVVIIKSRIPGARNNPYVEVVKSNIYIVDGKEVKKEIFENIHPLDIKTMNVLKEESAIKKYGNKGKNGVVEITTKNTEWKTESKMSDTEVIGYGKVSDTIRHDPWKVTIGVNATKFNDGVNITSIDGKEPICFLDGKEITKKEFQEINPDDIESITVLKDKSAIEVYGDKGKDGVVLITTKKNTSKSDSQKSFNDLKVIGYGKPSDSINNMHNIIIRGRSTAKGKSPLVIVDGKEFPYKKIESLDPDNIESITVLKDEKSTKKYGNKGKNGVIEITTKKK